MTTALLRDYYRELPERPLVEPAQPWQRPYQVGLDRFQQRVLERYTEGTLQRLLDATEPETRQAAVLALGLNAGMTSNRILAGMLHDEDATVRLLTVEAMWSIWFRAAAAEHNAELLRLVEAVADGEYQPAALKASFDNLIKQAPEFAEAYHQRGMFYLQQGEFAKAIKDCERTLKLNAHHFGAAGALAQCYLKQRKLRAALRAFRRSHRINPNLDGVQQTIESLEKTLGEEGKR